jgi:hypothetical protein
MPVLDIVQTRNATAIAALNERDSRYRSFLTRPRLASKKCL